MAKSNRQLLITLGADTTTFSQKVKRAKDLTKELDSNFKLLSSSSKDFEKSLDGLGKKQDYLNDKIKVATTLNDVYNERLADQQDRLNKSTKSMKALEKELEQLKDVQKRSLDVAEWDAWQEEIDKVEDELKQVTKETKNFQDSVIGLHTAINQNQTNIQKMNAELAETKIKFDMLSRDKTFEEMKKDIDETEREFDNIKNSTDGFGKALSDLKAEKAQLNNQMQKTNKLMDEYATDIAKSTSEMKKLENEIEGLITEYNAMKKAVDSMDGTEKHYEEWANELDKLGSELTSANRLLDIHRNRVENLENSYKQSENSIKAMEGSIKRVDNEIYNFGRQNNFKAIETHMESLRHEFDMLGSKMELLRSKYVNFETSVSGAMRESKLLKEQTKVLRQEFQAQQGAINEYKLKIQELSTKKKELITDIDKLKLSMKGLDESSPNFVKLNSELGEFERNLKSVEDEIEDVGNKLKQMELDSNSTLTNINSNIQAQSRTWETLGGRIQQVGSIIQGMGSGLQSVGNAMTPLTLGMTALGTGVITTGANFEKSMSKVKALSGATDEQFKKLEQTARDLGKSTVFSATDASEGLQYLALAGYSVQDSMDALPIILDSAVAGAMELGTASDLATDVLSSLGDNADFTGDKIKDLDILMNQVAKTSTKSNTSMEQLLEGYIKVGGQVENMNIPLSTANTMLAILADRGIKAEEAGNSLNSILINLTKTSGESAKAMEELGVSAFDAKGNIKPIEQTLGELKEKLSGLSEEKQIQLINMIGGKTQAKTLQKLLQGISADTKDFTEHYSNLRNEVEKSIDTGALQTLRKTMEDNLSTDWDELGSAVEEGFLTVYEDLVPKLREIVQSITKTVETLTKNDTFTKVFSSMADVIQKVIDKFNGLSPEMQENILKFVAWGAVLAPILTVLGGVLTGVGGIVNVFGTLTGGTGKVIEKFKLLKQNGLTIKGLFTNLSGTIKTVASTLGGKFTTSLSSVTKLFGGGAGLSGVLGTLSSVALPAIGVALGGLGVIFGDNEKALTSLIDKFGWFGTMLSGVSEFLNGAFKGIFGQVGNVFDGIGDTVKAVFKGDFKDIGDIWSETWSEMKSDAGSAWENITMTSTRSISSLRDYTEKDVKQIKTIFEDTYGQISQVTSSNLENVAQNITDMFTDSRGKSLSLASETIDILRGTSDTMRVLFSGVKSEMNIDVAKARFTENLNNLLNTGGTTAEQLAKDFENAWATIDANLIDGGKRLNDNASDILQQFGDVASGKIEQGVDDIVSVLDDLDVRGVQSLRGIGTNWNAIFAGISTDSKMTTEEMKNAILANIESLGLDTPEKLQTFKATLQAELDAVSLQASQDGKEVGKELLEGIETGTTEGVESTGESIKNATKAVTEQATTGAKEGFEQLPESVRQELEKAGVSINEQGNIIVQDMAQKGKQGADAYIAEMNAQLPQLSGVAGTIQQQLNGINTVRFGGVTKQLSEINRWLGVAKNSAVQTGASLAQITTVTFGGTTKGLSEINRWLKDNVTKSAKDSKTALKDITTVTFGSTTKGLSEVTKWLKDNVSPKAKSAKTDLQNLANIRFGGLTSSLSSVVNMLNNIANKANSTRTAINRVISTKGKSISMPVEVQQTPVVMPVLDTLPDITADINRFKTTGGFYNPTSIGTTASKSNESSSIGNVDALLKATLEQNQLLIKLLGQQKPVEVAVNMDGRQVAKASAKYMESEINLINARKTRLGGK